MQIAANSMKGRQPAPSPRAAPLGSKIGSGRQADYGDRQKAGSDQQGEPIRPFHGDNRLPRAQRRRQTHKRDARDGDGTAGNQRQYKALH